MFSVSKFFLVSFVFNFANRLVFAADVPCAPLDFGEGSVVCVCNATYCDTLSSPTRQEKGKYLLYTSSKGGLRLQSSNGEFGPVTDKIQDGKGFTWDNQLNCLGAGPIQLVIDRSKKFQKVHGFGGAFTDATGINLLSLDNQTRENVLQSYFGPKGIGYTMGRVPIGGTDFSDRCYTYDDLESPGTDPTLSKFKLQSEDMTYKIPFIHRALELTSSAKRNLNLVASAWSAPAWMKTNHKLYGRGKLQKQYYGLWAQYIHRFLEEYLKQNIKFWGLTTQNEPSSGFVPLYPFNCMGWSPSDIRDWLKEYLGPVIKNSTDFADTNIIIMDDIRPLLSLYSHGILSDPDAAKYASGIGIHWYADAFSSLNVLKETHDSYPDKFLLYTESCYNILPFEKHIVKPGLWERAEGYAKSIIDDLNNWVTGWIDWNLVTDIDGGPAWMSNRAESPIISDSVNKSVYKQTTFYAMAHFSKFILPDSAIIGLEKDLCEDDVRVVAAEVPDGSTVVVILNRSNKDRQFTITDRDRGSATIDVKRRSLQTFIYW